MKSAVSTRDTRRSTRITLRLAVLVTGVLTVILLFSLIFSDEGIAELQSSRARITELQQEIDRLESENARLRAEVEALQASTFPAERIAREDLGLARPGETVYLVPEPSDDR